MSYDQPRRPSFTPGPQQQDPRYGQQQPWPQHQQPYPPRPPQQPPAWQQQPPYQPPVQVPPSYQQAPAPRRKRRIFPWVFLAIQLLFIIWLVAGLAGTHTGPTQAQLAQGCYNHNWWPLFKNQADCVQHYGRALTDAGNAGKAIGAGIIVAAWVAVDVILGIGYGIWRLARR